MRHFGCCCCSQPNSGFRFRWPPAVGIAITVAWTNLSIRQAHAHPHRRERELEVSRTGLAQAVYISLNASLTLVQTHSSSDNNLHKAADNGSAPAPPLACPPQTQFAALFDYSPCPQSSSFCHSLLYALCNRNCHFMPLLEWTTEGLLLPASCSSAAR